MLDVFKNQVYQKFNWTIIERLIFLIFPILIVNFSNEESNTDILIKSFIIHFLFVYIHPFFDGNGRTGRALQYSFLLKNGVNYFKFFSISHILYEHRQKYYKTIKKVEDNDLDLTYFLIFNLEILYKNIMKIKEK